MFLHAERYIVRHNSLGKMAAPLSGLKAELMSGRVYLFFYCNFIHATLINAWTESLIPYCYKEESHTYWGAGRTNDACRQYFSIASLTGHDGL